MRVLYFNCIYNQNVVGGVSAFFAHFINQNLPLRDNALREPLNELLASLSILFYIFSRLVVAFYAYDIVVCCGHVLREESASVEDAAWLAYIFTTAEFS